MRRRGRPIASGSPRGRAREVDHAAIAAPSKALSVKSPPSMRPPRAASTSTTCFATLRRSSSPSPVTAEQLPATRRLDPAHQGHPPLHRRRRPPSATDSSAHEPPRPSRHARTPLTPSAIAPAPYRRRGDQPTRTDDQNRLARAAPVTPELHHDRLRGTPRRLRTQDLTLHQAVTDDHQPTAHGLSGLLAARARARPRLRARRHPLAPGLDSQHARDKPWASCLFYGGCEARRRGRSRQEAPSSSPISAGCSPFARPSTRTARRWPSSRLDAGPGGFPRVPRCRPAHRSPARRAGAMTKDMVQTATPLPPST